MKVRYNPRTGRNALCEMRHCEFDVSGSASRSGRCCYRRDYAFKFQIITNNRLLESAVKRYVLKQKFWSWGDSFHIYDEDRNPVFSIRGQVFSWGDKLSFEDMNGKELAFIDQKILNWFPTYSILRGGKPFATVKKEFSWLNKTFTLDVPGPNDYVIQGQFWSYNYQFMRRNRIVAQVGKTVWSWTDTYGIEMDDDEDEISILCTAIVIDQVLYDERRNN